MKLLFIIFILLFICLIICSNYIKELKIEMFLSKYMDPSLDGKINYSYLRNPDYTKDILNKYYLNDDTRKFSIKYNYYPLKDKRRYYYSNHGWVYIYGYNGGINGKL